MSHILDSRGMTMREALGAAADRWADDPLFIAPPHAGRDWDPDGRTLTYRQIQNRADRIAAALHIAGFGPGHRIALDLENRPEHIVWVFAAAAVGVSVVPINPDLRPAEVAYILTDSRPCMAVVAASRTKAFGEANHMQCAETHRPIRVLTLEKLDMEELQLPTPPGAYPGIKVTPDLEACLIYTSGTTGKPKGCIISQAYGLEIGRWYAITEGVLNFQEGDRLYNPLPLFHVNALFLSFFGMLHMGGAQIQPQRFSRAAWWRDIRECRATVAHYLGVVIPVLMAGEPEEDEKNHALRVMMGAGVEPSLHRPAEERFGVLLVEGWGMTEMCRALVADTEPRMIDTRAIGRPREGLEVQVWDERCREVPRGRPGEMVLRSAGPDPKLGFFSGYLNKEEATAEAWKGGWFHTGDTVTMDESGMVFFVDRKKNIIRRSGENIAAAEVEACLLDHPACATVAVIAVEDEIRDEEVMACVTLKTGWAQDAATAEALFAHVFERLAYYKAPGWLRFFDDLPVTGTQKIQKHALFAEGEAPTDRALDFRGRKKRDAA